MNYQTLNVRFQEKICFIEFYRPNDKNAINEKMLIEFHSVLQACEDSINIIVIEGSDEVFCNGGDFKEVKAQVEEGYQSENYQNMLYDLWLKFVYGPFITVSHVRGRVNAGGMGFVAASDIVLANKTASFSLSEMLFGIYPACVMPFLIKRIGFQHANYLTLITKNIVVEQAMTWGLVDEYSANSNILLKTHLTRLKCISKASIIQYKNYMKQYTKILIENKEHAIMSNKIMFSDETVVHNIVRYLDSGELPWR